MSLAWTALVLSIGYLALLFGVAYWGDRRAESGRSVVGGPLFYTLSLAVYCTAWTFYGSVGLAAAGGLAFLPIYLGPTVVVLFFNAVLRKIVTITKAYGITSIADFTASRYGKSALLGGLVTIVGMAAVIPYISLQLKAVSLGVEVMIGGGVSEALARLGPDTALIVTGVLAAFAILFGARGVDATEHHAGMVLTVAVESLVKLLCFLIVGVFVCFFVFDGLGSLLTAAADAGFAQRFSIGSELGYADWFLLTLVSGLAFVVLPRQFQVAVIENPTPDNLRRAGWLLPIYFFVINLFVVPIAMAGLLAGLPVAEGDSFVLAIPLLAESHWVAMVAYLGGLSAATAMVIVETVALSTMISNDLAMPVLLRLRRLGRPENGDLGRMILNIRRGAILAVLVGGYLFFEIVGTRYALASIGLISFAGVAQVAPAIVAGLYWKDANRQGALAGLGAGVFVWLYTLVLPAFGGVGGVPADIATGGPFGIALLAPYALFGVQGLDPVPHALAWSLSVNAILLVAVSLVTSQSALERLQAVLFVEVERNQGVTRGWYGDARVAALQEVLTRFLGPERIERIITADARRRGRRLSAHEPADAAFVETAERQLARAIGAASARVVVASIVRGEVIGPADLMEILDETSRVLDYSRRLEQKSQALEEATSELRRVNERLLELDRLKDDFMATVSHELRTPLTSIRAFSEILSDNPDLAPDEQRQFLEIVVRETERLTRLIDDLLDLAKIEAGSMSWQIEVHDAREMLQEAASASEALMAERAIALTVDLPSQSLPVECDHDRLLQVLLNLLSNAAKFTPPGGRVRLGAEPTADGQMVVVVEDSGPGVPAEWRELMFERFRQVSADLKSRPKGSGLGLAICREIVARFGGRIWAEESRLGGTAIRFALPLQTPVTAEAAE